MATRDSQVLSVNHGGIGQSRDARRISGCHSQSNSVQLEGMKTVSLYMSRNNKKNFVRKRTLVTVLL